MSDCPTKKMHSLYRRKKRKKIFFIFFIFLYIYTLFFIWTGQTVGQKWCGVSKKRRFYAGLRLLVLKVPAIWIVGRSRTVSGNWTQKSTAGIFFRWCFLYVSIKRDVLVFNRFNWFLWLVIIWYSIIRDNESQDVDSPALDVRVSFYGVIPAALVLNK